MQNRIKQIRKALNLNQEDFGKLIGAKQSTITAYECGNRVPMDVTIKSICKNFGINELWLRTGEGDMYALDQAEKQTADYLSHAITHNTTAKDKFLRAAAITDDKTLEAVVNFMLEIANQFNKEKEPS